MTTPTQPSKLDDLIERMESATFHHPSKTDIADALTVAFRRMGAEARTELAALRRRAEDAEWFIGLSKINTAQHAAPIYVEDEPGRGKGWAIYFDDDRYVFLPMDDATGLPIITDEARKALEVKP